MNYLPITETVRARICTEIGSECALHAPEALTPYGRDASELCHTPELVILPKTTEQVSRLLRLANELRFPVTPRGAGTGLSGGCLTPFGGVVLSLERMDRILAIDADNLVAEVEPGVITQTLRDAAKAKGLFYPPDPAGMDKSTIGGNAATNAGGPACLKYGVTRDYVLGLEAVLPTGEVIRAGTRTRKGVVGYDLARLIVGSEGTLGIITGLTLKLIPHPKAVAGMAAVFPSMASAMRAVSEIMRRGFLPSALEFMDYKCIGLVRDLLPFPAPEGQAAMLVIESDGAAEQVGGDIEAMAAVCSELGAAGILRARDQAEAGRVWAARRAVSLRIHDSAPLYMSEDIVVPLGNIAELAAELPGFEERFGLKVYAFGHAGDGNMHLNVTAPDKSHKPLAMEGARAILARVLELGGTISGEHGIGEAKMPFVPMELSPASMRLQKGIKRLFDPNLILNPGKIFEDL
ncbi:FAD/FMN-dependent dehydrogenase [Desulfocurvibacter africanus PCS]|uniref:FAD/FMN-dependent dehydrogenase n=1 Tax=Desulfocurvibacter africanus PCS TaxID=1262666 RepID=M5PVB8_DESAF|nr:FAD-linked oxidase C-terminal domain-containing protein [Desulfocurvibacter africanus]EMG38292.1 FAD/FMN-dependent dehydrogenase [Desulfocurvibacter africanus PCS]